MARVVHFELYADEPKRAVAFYERVFGWKVKKWDGPEDYWLITTGSDDLPGINGGIMRRPKPQASTCNTVGVDSVDEATKAVKDAGGKMVTLKMAIPGVGYIAYCQDTENNVFGVMETDASAQ